MRRHGAGVAGILRRPGPDHRSKASDNQTVQNFRYKVLRELAKIKLAWPDLNYGTARGLLILYPSAPHIAPTPWAGTGLDLTLRRD